MMEEELEQPIVPGKESPTIVKQRRLLNRWSLFALFFITAGATVGYVSNVISVNHLSAEANTMKRQRDSMRVLIQSLRTESYRLQSSERITRIAIEELGMVPPEEAPTVIGE
jgi:cell division protein FtsL